MAPRFGSGRLSTHLKTLWESDRQLIYDNVGQMHKRWKANRDKRCLPIFSRILSQRIGDDRCYSGPSKAYPKVNITQALQIAAGWGTETRTSWSTESVNLGDKRTFTEQYWVTVTMDDHKLLQLATGGFEASHLCNHPYRIHPRHLKMEIHSVNTDRGSCLRSAKENPSEIHCKLRIRHAWYNSRQSVLISPSFLSTIFSNK
jgi:hypothetical protein